MTSTSARAVLLTIAVAAGRLAPGRAQATPASWLDNAKPAGWNEPGLAVPPAPRIDAPEPRCSAQARPPELDEDTALGVRGWELVGPYQAGWQTIVIRATAAYDGMCRPRQYQDFVFVRGVFAGTLSPQAMDSRTDGAIGRVFLQSGSRIMAEYQRYTAADPLCCPSGSASVQFEITGTPPVVRPLSATRSAR